MLLYFSDLFLVITNEQCRILYFFYGRNVSVLAHSILKKDQIPRADLDRAVERKRKFEKNPDQHSFEGDVHNG